MADAVEAVAARRQPDGTWLVDASSEDSDVLGETVRQPSRWNTLRALRVLRWYGA
jgi:hypothetical protein